MTDITDKMAREWADRHSLDGIPMSTLRCALDDARSIPELQAQQPVAQAVVAWRYRHGPRCTNWQDGQPPPEVLKDGYPYQLAHTHPQPPSIPEPSDEDINDAYRAAHDGTLRQFLTTYTARLRERIGGGS